MKPYFFVSGGSKGGPIIDSLNDRFTSITIVDNAGYINDRMSLQIDDRPDPQGKYFKVPVRGDKLTVHMGYLSGRNMDMPTDMIPMGTFIIDEIEVEFGPDTLILHAHASDTNGRFKQSRSKAFHRTTIKKIVEDCAKFSGMTAAVHDSLKDKEIAHEDQIMQSCAEFLRVFGEKNDAVVKVSAGKILFGPKGKLSEISGAKDLIRPSVTVNVNQFKPGTARYTSQGKSKYAEVWANYVTPDNKNSMDTYHITIKDVIGADKGDSSEGNVGPTATYQVPGVFANKTEAINACRAKMRMLALSECGFGFTLYTGNPEIVAESKITVEGLRPGIMKVWNALRVTHKMDGSGFTTSVECESVTKETDKKDTPTITD